MLTRTRIAVDFYRGPVRGPHAWKGKNRLQATWVYDAFKDETGQTVALRCYKCSQHGCESRLQDGWLTKDQAKIAEKREELRKLKDSNYTRAEVSEPEDFDGAVHPIRSLADVRL